MKLNQILQETPIAGYETLSDTPKSPRGDPSEIRKSPEDFEKRSSSYTDKRDRRLLTNPISVKRMKNLFDKTSVDFYFYMVNTKEARDYTEVGRVFREWLKKNMPGVEPHIKDHPDGITVIFTNNKGDQKIPMTPWIMAHRIAHSFNRFDRIYNYIEIKNTINETLNGIIYDFYGYNASLYGNFRKSKIDEFTRRKFFEEIGTFRSARKKMLRSDFEFINELFAQYLITGNIKFNPLPEKFKTFRLSKYGDSINREFRFRGDKKEANELLETLGRDLEYHVENMLAEAIGQIFVM